MATAQPNLANKTPQLEPALTTDPAPTSTSTIRLVGNNNNNKTPSQDSTHLPAPSHSPPPSVKVTPASPTNQASTTFDGPKPIDPSATSTPSASSTPGRMKEKQPTDSETALVSNSTPGSSVDKEKVVDGEHEPRRSSEKSSAKPGPIQKLTRQLSGKAAGKSTSTAPADAEKATPAATATTSTSKPPAATPSSSNAVPAASTSQAPRSTAQPSTHKKKRKRKGLAGFLLALGCLSASEFEEEEKSTRTTEKSATANPAESKRPVTSEKVADAGKAGGGAASTSGSASGGTSTPAKIAAPATKSPMVSTPAKGTDVVVAPVTPVSVPEDETAGVLSAAVQQPGSGSELLSTPHRSASNRDVGLADTTPPKQGSSAGDVDKTDTSGGYSDMPDTDMLSSQDSSGAGEEHEGEYPLEDEYEDEEDRLIAQGGMGIPLDEHGNPAPLLPIMDKVHMGRKCLVLDLDETLLHSSFKMLPNASFIVPVEIEGQTHNVYVIKRPGVDNFLTEMGKIYEVVVFTASLSKYADPVLDMLDVDRVVRHRLFRESCYNHKGNYVKDLSQLGRDIHDTIIIDNSPASYIFHPNNAVPVSTWFNDPHDTELTDLCPFLTDLAAVTDVRGVLDGSI